MGYYDIHNQDDISYFLNKSELLQNEFWTIATEAVSKGNRPIYNLVLDSLNSVIDVDAERRLAFRDHVPEAVFIVILLIMVMSLYTLGINYGKNNKHRISGLVLSALFSLIFAMIIDIDRPRKGLIRVPNTSLEELRHSLEKATYPEVSKF